MRRLLLVVVVAALSLPARPAAAEPFIAGAAFDAPLVADVTATALAFMAPRTLVAIPLARLSLWGLRGLSTLDPRLLPELVGDELRLSLLAGAQRHLLLARTLPDAAQPAAWGDMVAALIRAAWDASQPVRRVGTNGALEVFFDEICNHLDPYSRYATPGEAQADRDLRADAGIDVVMRHGGYVIAGVAEAGPAEATEVRPGERLLAVDGQSLAGASPADVAALLAGPEESEVVLLLRDATGRRRAVTLRRAIVPPQTVHRVWFGRLPVLRITAFATDTGAQLARALGGSGGSASRGVVLDLRGNRGGLLREAVAAAETLLADGVIAVTIGRDPAADHAFRADGEDRAGGRPVVVLVDGGSASAAEILAAALADQRRAVVVGSATVGKGLVQAVARLPNGGELLLSWSRVLAPLGWPIQGLGLLPQICTSLGEAATTAQLRALEHGEQPMREALARHRAARAPVGAADTLAVRGACPAAEGHDGDVAAARYLLDHPGAYATALLGPP